MLLRRFCYRFGFTDISTFVNTLHMNDSMRETIRRVHLNPHIDIWEGEGMEGKGGGGGREMGGEGGGETKLQSERVVCYMLHGRFSWVHYLIILHHMYIKLILYMNTPVTYMQST